MPKVEADQWWFSRGQWRDEGTSERTLCAMAYEAGERNMLVATTKLSPHIGQFLHMCVLLGILESDEIRQALVDAIAATISDQTGSTPAGARETSYSVEPPY